MFSIIGSMPLVAVTGKMLLIIMAFIAFNLFIGTEASCEVPLSPEHGTLHLLGGSQVGSIALYACDKGWDLAGSTHSNCLISGEWTFPPPKCVNRFCKAPKDPENGMVTYTTLHEGSKLTFVCNNGYHLQDTRPVYCTSDGEWSRADMKCVAKACDHPERPENGLVIVTSLNFGSQLKFKCNDGYLLKSDELVFCTPDGTWSKTDVQCVVAAKACDRPEELEHGQVTFTSLNFGSQLKFKCDDGYQLKPNEPVFCTSDGTWNGTDVRCVATTCYLPNHPKNGKVSFESPTFQSKLKFKCDDGYLLKSDEPVFCRPDGTWSKTDVQCVAKACDRPEELEHGQVTFTSLNFGSQLKFKCDDGYLLKPNEPVFCTADGTWNGTDVRCIVRSCGKPGFVPNANRIGNLFTFPNKVEFQCQEGYKLKGPAVRFCQASGTWSGRLPKCDRMEVSLNCSCSYNSHDRKLSADINGFGLWNGDKVRKGDKVTLRCYDQAKHLVLPNATSISGTLELICDDCRIWEDSDLPSCEDDGSEGSCERPLAPKNGDVHIAGIPKVGTVAVFSCKEGKMMVGPSATKCLSTGEWTSPPPKCLSPCVLSAIPNGSVGHMQASRVSRYKTEEWFVKFQVGKIFKDEETAIFRCSNGFEPVGSSQPSEDRRQSGDVVTCTDGQWSKSLECKPESCYGEPPPVDNGYPVVSNNSHGLGVYYHCNKYYLKAAKEDMNCSYGQWIGKTPRCIDGRCYVSQLNYPGLRKPPVDFIEHEKDYPAKCKKGFKTSSRRMKISCNTGKWNTIQGICVAATCDGEPPSMDNGYPVVNNRSHGYFIYYNCNKYYVKSANGYMECSYGQWTGNTPTCIDGRCYASQLIHPGLEKPSANFIEHGKDYPATCIKGFKASYQWLPVLCNAGKWNVPDIICMKEDCIVPWIPNGHIVERVLGPTEYNFFKFKWERKETYRTVEIGSVPSSNATLFLVCQDRYYIQGTDISTGSIICADGRWLPDLVCLRNSEALCRRFLIDEKELTVEYDGADTRVGSRATFSCRKNGQNLNGASIATCLKSEEWSSPPPQCIDIMCRELKGSDLMTISYTDNRKIGSFANFHCFAPGIHSGVRRTQCLENGEWKDSSPICRTPPCLSTSLSQVIPHIVAYDNEDVTMSTMPYNSTVKLMCRGDKNLLGNPFARCGREGKWEVGNITCISGCPPVVKASGSRLFLTPEKKFYRIGESVTLSCRPGYKLSTELEVVMCLENHRWSADVLPECIKWYDNDVDGSGWDDQLYRWPN